MTTRLPPPAEIAAHYNDLMQELAGEYVYQRWGDSEIKRRHYRQTERGIRFALDQLQQLGDVLEIGSGPAVWTTLYLAEAKSAVLLDISEKMLDQARLRLEKWANGDHSNKTRYLCGDFLEVPQPSQQYVCPFAATPWPPFPFHWFFAMPHLGQVCWAIRLLPPIA